jgi:AraC-like DNA-binding protein
MVRLVELARNPSPASGRLLSGALGHLLARLECAARTEAEDGAGFVGEACRTLADPEGRRRTVMDLSSDLGISYSWFRRRFRERMGLPPQRYRLLQELERARRLLEDTDLPVGVLAAQLGFSSQAYFARVFRRETGLSPTVWRRTRSLATDGG